MQVDHDWVTIIFVNPFLGVKLHESLTVLEYAEHGFFMKALSEGDRIKPKVSTLCYFGCLIRQFGDLH